MIILSTIVDVDESNKVLQTEMLFFTDLKDQRYYPRKKALTIGIGSGRKEVPIAKKKSASFFIKYMEFVLTRNHFNL